MASRLWVSKKARISENYQTTLQNHYGGDIRPVDFKNTNEAVSEINQWVQQNTQQHINSIVESGTFL